MKPTLTERYKKLLATAKPSKEAGPHGDTDNPPSTNHAPGQAGVLRTTCAATVKPKPLRWLVPNLLPLGKLILLAGDGGLGKSSISIDLAARLSCGECAFGLRYPALAADSLIVSCEDDPADTIIPRLLAAGADRTRVHLLDGVGPEDGRPAPWSLAHHEALDSHLATHPEIRLVVIDPASAFAGMAGIDGHKDTELRALLGPLTEAAARHAVTIMLLAHIGKGETTKAARRVLGSVAWVNAVRAAWVVAEREADEGKRLLLPMKANLAPRASGLFYQLVPLTLVEQDLALASCPDLEPDDRERLKPQLFRVEWLGETNAQADEVFASSGRQRAHSSDIKAAAEWLAARLKDGPVSSTDCLSEGNEALDLDRPLKWWRDSVLKRELGGKPRRLGFGEEGEWYFTLSTHGWPPNSPVEDDSPSTQDSMDSLASMEGTPWETPSKTRGLSKESIESNADTDSMVNQGPAASWTAPDASPDVLHTPFDPETN